MTQISVVDGAKVELGHRSTKLIELREKLFQRNQPCIVERLPVPDLAIIDPDATSVATTC